MRSVILSLGNFDMSIKHTHCKKSQETSLDLLILKKYSKIDRLERAFDNTQEGECLSIRSYQ